MTVIMSARGIQILIYPFVLATGTFAGVLHPMADFDYTAEIGRATAHFRVPQGWHALRIDQKMPHHATLVRATSGNKQQSVPVNLDFYHIHSFQTDKTQQGCADEYLDGIQRHSDKNIEMDIVSNFYTCNNGVLNIYRYHSDYWRERWAVFIVKGDYEVHLEIYAHDFADTGSFASYLQAVAEGVSIEGSNPAMRPTAGWRTVPLPIMKTLPEIFTRALARRG